MPRSPPVLLRYMQNVSRPMPNPVPAARRASCQAILSVGLWALSGCAHPPAYFGAQPSPVLWDSLRPGTTLRVRAGTQRLEGRLRSSTPDSLFLTGPDSVVVARLAIDTLWRRNTHRSSGAVAGLIAGGAFAVALILTDHSGGEDPGLNRSVGLIGGVGLVLLGAVASSLEPDWELLYGRRPT